MKTIYGINNFEQVFDKPVGIGLGTFDGLHIGHMVLINTLINECKRTGLNSVLYTFSRHPENVLNKRIRTPLITTEAKKIELLKETALDYVFFEEFNETFSKISAENFVKNVLVDRFNIKLAVAGFNYRFGHRGLGDVKLLEKFGKVYGFKVIIVPPIKFENEVVSSTLIRNTILKGEMEKANKLLGRPFSIAGEVKGGKGIGRKLGFPTANIYPENYHVLPKEGVYITKTLVDGRFYKSITNIGSNPTFEEDNPISIETYILDFNDDIYNKKIEVFFIKEIRAEKKFINKDELIKQVKEDINRAKEFFALKYFSQHASPENST
ncbi:MAG TPA: bifunctional riboflavin kinase/FAD synthetase [Clostridiaceae bacterium]|nr:bifunctional riboflavin kinase/FAD synthetase [Clostridiaceae bacterium]